MVIRLEKETSALPRHWVTKENNLRSTGRRKSSACGTKNILSSVMQNSRFNAVYFRRCSLCVSRNRLFCVTDCQCCDLEFSTRIRVVHCSASCCLHRPLRSSCGRVRARRDNWRDVALSLGRDGGCGGGVQLTRPCCLRGKSEFGSRCLVCFLMCPYLPVGDTAGKRFQNRDAPILDPDLYLLV